MRSIVVSLQDTASVNIRDRLLEMAEWEEASEFKGNPAYRHGTYLMVQHEGPHIYAEGIDKEISDFAGEEPEVIIFASKHKSASGNKALTVHTVGNYGKAEYGGRERTLSRSCPRLKTEALRIIARRNTLPDFSVSYEVTHHGPFLETPSFFIEIGSGEEEWKNAEAGRIIASVILELEGSEGNEDVVAIGIGGGHYAPRFTELAVSHRISFGHMAPKYALENLDEGMLSQMVEMSGAERVYFHKVGLKRSDISRMKAILERMGVKRIREGEIQEIVSK